MKNIIATATVKMVRVPNTIAVVVNVVVKRTYTASGKGGLRKRRY